MLDMMRAIQKIRERLLLNYLPTLSYDLYDVQKASSPLSKPILHVKGLGRRGKLVRETTPATSPDLPPFQTSGIKFFIS